MSASEFGYTEEYIGGDHTGGYVFSTEAKAEEVEEEFREILEEEGELLTETKPTFLSRLFSSNAIHGASQNIVQKEAYWREDNVIYVNDETHLEYLEDAKEKARESR